MAGIGKNLKYPTHSWELLQQRAPNKLLNFISQMWFNANEKHNNDLNCKKRAFLQEIGI